MLLIIDKKKKKQTNPFHNHDVLSPGFAFAESQNKQLQPVRKDRNWGSKRRWQLLEEIFTLSNKTTAKYAA